MPTNEIFRFMTLRSVQKASLKIIKSKFILPVNHVPVSLPNIPTMENYKQYALAFVNAPDFKSNINTANEQIGKIDEWLTENNDYAAPEKVGEKIKEVTDTYVHDLPGTSEYISNRNVIYTALVNLILAPTGKEWLRGKMLRSLHIFGLIEQLALQPSPLTTADDVFNYLTRCHVVLPAYFPTPMDALSREPLTADLKVVKQTLKGYEMGEIAYIENILKREFKERVHRKKDVREQTSVIESERETTQSQELQKSERFELQQEASSIIKEDSHFDAGVNVTASYGPTVTVTANAGIAMNNSKEESKKVSSTYAKDVTERSAQSIREKTRTQLTVTTISEVEETNSHGIDNKSGTDHIIGIYRYVDKVYTAQVYNYGPRMMLEFIVPEPASFIKTLRNQPVKVSMSVPEKPETSTGVALKPSDIVSTNYLDWAAKYFVQDVAPPPAQSIWLGVTIENPANPDVFDINVLGHEINKISQSFKVPADRVATQVKGIFGYTGIPTYILLNVGGQSITFGSVPANPFATQVAFYFVTGLNEHISDILPIGITVKNAMGFEVTMSILCELTTEGLQKWQFETYSKIIRAYFELKSMYEEQIAAAETQKGISIQGTNPVENRKTEQTELKKHVIAMLEKQYYNQPPVDKEAIQLSVDSNKYPEINFDVAKVERDYIQWFEQAFEWQNMTYAFYPYYWGNKANWKDEIFGTDPDPIFNKFLQSGAARVVVPVRHGFDSAMGLYLSTGIIWNGKQIPQTGELFISIIQEIQEQLDAPDGGTAEDKSWEVRLPTPLVILQETGTLPMI